MPMSKLQEKLITSAVAKLAPDLLSMAGEKFGNHGCNDFDLQEHGLSRAEQEALTLFMLEHEPLEGPDAIKALPWSSDFSVMYACAKWLRRSKETGGVEK